MISVIRALSASETNEQREIEKAKLEKEYKKSDQRLDELVSLHDQDLTQVMQVSLITQCKMMAFMHFCFPCCRYSVLYQKR